jgi:hypothetical protein
MELSIEDAFTTEAIEAAGVNVGGDLEDELTDVVKRIYTSNKIEVPDLSVAAEIGRLCFVAGRAYQEQFNEQESRMLVPMTPEMLSGFIDYLIGGRDE